MTASKKQVQRIVAETLKFCQYVLDFYGPGGIYDMGATISQIADATKILIEKYGSKVQFDSLDRERVRDIMIDKFNLKFPESTD